MIMETKALRVFVHKEAIDMRFGFEKLTYLVREKMQAKISEGHLFLFLGKNRKRLKALYFDGSGLVLTHKRMEKSSFMSVEDLSETTEISIAELKLIMHGSVLRKPVLERMVRQKQTKSDVPSLPFTSVVQSHPYGDRLHQP